MRRALVDVAEALDATARDVLGHLRYWAGDYVLILLLLGCIVAALAELG